MKKLFTPFSVILLTIICCEQHSSDCENEAEATSIQFESFSNNENYSSCQLGDYNQDEKWVLNSIADYERWKEDTNCDLDNLINETDFELSTILVGYISHPNTGLKVEKEEVLKGCDSESITYKIEFEVLQQSFAALSTFNYGIVIDKVNPDQISFKTEKND